MLDRRTFLAGLAASFAVAAFGLPGFAAAPAEIEVWKSPSCGCCGGWVEHLRRAGFAVKVHDMDDLAAVKSANGVPARLGSCHTARVGGYVLEGHVPAADVKRLLAERPAAKGLAVPGMPMDSPGMDGNTGVPYAVILFGGAEGDTVYARH
jgi:hypothetical protein